MAEVRAADPKQVQQLLDTKICERCDLSEADLTNQNLHGAKLAGAILRDAKFAGADLGSADLTGARLGGAKLAGVKLLAATLNNTGLERTDLTGANLSGAEMKSALMSATKLSDAKLYNVDLDGAVFEPASLPNIESVAGAANLKSMTYGENPAALSQLRKAFKKEGYQDQRKDITYALMHTQRTKSNAFFNAAQYALFELTCDWGLAPFRPILLLLLLIPPFAFFYVVAILRPRGTAGIWRIWDKDRICQDIGSAEPVRLDQANSKPVLDSLYFSFMSAFSVSWHELDIGTWMGRLNPNEYTLRATGWLRSVSGVQSLVSIFLLVLTFLCYFGDPFE